MRWEGKAQSDNVEDRREGGGGGLPIGGRGIGLGTLAVALIAGWIFGVNPLTVLGLLSGAETAPQVQQQRPAPTLVQHRFQEWKYGRLRQLCRQ